MGLILAHMVRPAGWYCRNSFIEANQERATIGSSMRRNLMIRHICGSVGAHMANRAAAEPHRCAARRLGGFVP